eukprot:SAG31_NODE_534_length_14370_cov_121.217434_10_plen_270_part_00
MAQACATKCPNRVDNLWISSQGVTVQAHYDLVNNFFVQIAGTKLFTIWSPHAITLMQVHPNNHPSGRQSQLELTLRKGGEDKCAAGLPGLVSASAPAVESLATQILLRPGEALFLPSYWLHHVISLNGTISYNVWWEDAMARHRHHMQDLISQGLNNILDIKWASDQKLMVAAARSFANSTLNQLFSDSRGFVEHMWSQRYTPLFDKTGHKLKPFDSSAMCAPLGGTSTSAMQRAPAVDRAAAPLVTALRNLPASIARVEAVCFNSAVP